MRHSLSAKDVELFLNAIHTNNISQFGIVKLSSLNLNTIIRVEHNDIVNLTTLISFAAQLDKGNIVAALLRAGANPTVVSELSTEKYIDASQLLFLSQPYSIWLIREIQRMRTYDIETDYYKAHGFCEICTTTLRQSYPSSNPLLQYKICHHFICWECCWKYTIANCAESFNCPLCSQRNDCGLNENDIYGMKLDSMLPLTNKNSELFALNLCPLDYGYNRTTELSCTSESTITSPSVTSASPIPSHASINAQLSLQVFDLLPNDISDGRYKHTPKQHLQALPFHEAVALYIGCTKTHRVIEYFKAVASNNFFRLLAIIRNGIDINARNEYNQCALDIAIYYNYIRIVKLLLWCNIQLTCKDNSCTHWSDIIYSNYLFNKYPIDINDANHIDECDLGRLHITHQDISGQSSLDKEDVISSYCASNGILSLLQNIDLNTVQTNMHANSIVRSLPCRNYLCNNPLITTHPIVTHIPIDPRKHILQYTTSIEEDAIGNDKNDKENISVSCPNLNSRACYIDNCFSEEFLSYLEYIVAECCPIAPPEKASCSDRYYIFDSMKIVQNCIQSAISRCRSQNIASTMESDVITSSPAANAILQVRTPLPHMRYLCYQMVGGSLAPHVDLSRTDTQVTHRVSTHTFILYLSHCTHGGETVFLDTVKENYQDLYCVSPKRGRLLLFPHYYPHRGEVVNETPKLLLRGEMIL